MLSMLLQAFPFQQLPRMVRLEKLNKLRKAFFVSVVAVFLFILLVALLWKSVRKSYNNSITSSDQLSQMDFNNSFPSISLCEILNEEKFKALSEKYFGEKRDEQIDEFYKEISFFTGACYTCKLCEAELNCTANFTDVLDKFRTSCKDLFKECSWNNEPFECCEGFRPLATEFGVCYSINSALTVPKYGKKLTGGPQDVLKLTVTADIQMFVHQPHDVPFASEERNLRQTILLGLSHDMAVNVTEISNAQDLVAIPISQRSCRFPWENKEPTSYDLYSLSTCQTNFFNSVQRDICNCSHHLMPRNCKLNR